MHTDPKDQPIILYDGVCGLCNSTVNWVIRHDRRDMFRFAPLQSAAARQILNAAGLDADDLQSVCLVVQGRILTKSRAFFGITAELGFPWAMLRLARIVPSSIADAIYDWIARNRYSWFGRRAECPVPSPALLARLLKNSTFPGPSPDREPQVPLGKA